jgi:hypothetical protein
MDEYLPTERAEDFFKRHVFPPFCGVTSLDYSILIGFFRGLPLFQ